MKNRSPRTSFHGDRTVMSCSLMVLAALGVLTCAADAQAQSTRPPLPVLKGVVSGRAVVNSPVAGAARQLMTIDQSTSRAIIDWKSFNIARDAEVRFNQPNATSSTLNRIYSADASVIQGKLTANGQVLLINQNGILFDRGAQVNVQSLVASSLNITNDRFNSGALTSGGLTSPAFAGRYDENGNTIAGQSAAINIGLGGSSTDGVPQLSAKAGGSILIFAPNINNQNGLITAPDGQVILAAGGKAYLALADDTDPTLRGFQVEIEAAGGSPVNVTDFIRNSGIISADRGNVTLAALAIKQDGRVSANTAIQANGSIFLKARTLNGTQAGRVEFGAGSVTQVLPDAQDKTTLPEGQRYDEDGNDRRGEIRVQGQTIASSGTLQVPGGKITLDARDAEGSTDPTSARVYLDAGSLTSVAGNWVDVPFADNLLTFKITSNELKNSPDQKLGVLKGATVTVDLRKGSPLLDLSGYVAAQGRTVSQKTAVGGELDIRSSGSLIQRSGATLDASGGGYRYGAGTSTTSLLLGADGKFYDISSAAEQRAYKGLADTYTRTSVRWGQTQVFSSGVYGIGKSEAGYVEGKAGGLITLKSSAGLVLDGALKGGVTVGPNQLASAPRGASLVIGGLDSAGTEFEGARIGSVTFAQKATDTLGAGFGTGASLSSSQIDKVSLAAEQLYGPASSSGGNVYLQNAFDSVEINSNGLVSVPQGVHIDGAPGSSLTLRGPQIDVAGAITLPGGNITLQPVGTSNPIDSSMSATNNSVTVRGTASLSTAGVWINNASSDGSYVGDPLPSARQDVDPSTKDITYSNASTLNGGKLTIGATLNSATELERGAQLDVGGGAALGRGGKLTAGDGGTLSISNGLSTSLNPEWLQADLSGLSFGNGGKLELETQRVEIAPEGTVGVLPANTTRLTPALFSEHGFSSVAINATQGIDIRPGTTMALQQKTRVLDPLAAGAIATGTDLRSASTAQQLTDDARKPMSLSLNTAGGGIHQSTLTMAEGSAIVGDPGAAISLSARDALQVDGRITAAGGNVSLALKASVDGADDLTLGSKALISVAGTFVPTPSNDGLLQGRVVNGGSITISASSAATDASLTGVKLGAGSVLDVSGITQTVESRAPDGSGGVLRQAVDGNAGSLVIRSQGGVVLGSTLHAAAGSTHGAGGGFALELNARNTELAPPVERRIVVSQTPATASAADPAFVDAAVSIDTLQAAGFQKLRLQSENRIELRGDVTANFERGIRLDAPLLDITGNGRVSLQGASVALGQSLDPRGGEGVLVSQGVSPVLPARSGSGVLSVQADTIDLFGSLLLNGAAETRLFAEGDIRLTGRTVMTDGAAAAQVGSLTTTGNLTLSAAQVYPSTRSDFTLSVTEQPGGTPVAGGTIAIAGNGKTAGDVYSAGGHVALVADTIVQGGTIKAPLGEIDLKAAIRLELSRGSVTSVSAANLIIPYGSTKDGLSWQYNDGGGVLADHKRIALEGTTIDVRAGATVDLSGGGEIQAREFVPGSGGSKDTLIQPNTYAIIPKALLSSMPVDTDLAAAQDMGFGLQTARYDSSMYDSLHIGRGAAVPEGDYVLLPGRYALLPGAYMVQLQTGSNYANLQPGQTSQLLNGQAVVTGWRTASGTDIRESRTVGVVVRPGSDATRESDYRLTTSSEFTRLAELARTAAPQVPIDAGHLAISNTSALNLAGDFKTAAATGGNAALVDISAEKIAVVDKIGTDFGAGTLQLEGGALSALGGSLLLGGQRTAEGEGVRITTQAQQITVANSAAGALTAAELLLSSNDRIDVRSGAVLNGTGAASGTTATSITASGDGALLRLSAGAQATVDRGLTGGGSGDLRIDNGAVLNAGGSLLLDATKSVQSQGQFTVAGGGAVSLASSKVSLGEVTGVAGLDDGLVLSNGDLSSLAGLKTLAIKGYQGIDLYGDAKLGDAAMGELTLDTAALRGNVAGAAVPAAQIAAKQVTLLNTGSNLVADVAGSSGALTIDAQRIVIGSGAQKINGYGAVAMNASSEIVGQGTGSLVVAGDWTLSTPKVGVAAGAVQTWQAADLRDAANPVYTALNLVGAQSAAGTSTDNAAGGRLRLEGGRVDVATTVQARSGSIAIAALGNSGDVTLDSGSLLDVRGVAKSYNGNVVVADAGRVDLSSAHSAVTTKAGSTIDARGLSGGDAGSVRVNADTVALAGTLSGSAEAGGTTGRFALDLNRGDQLDFSALNTSLNLGSFNEARSIRLRQGDLHVGTADVVQAHALSLSADSGRIDIEGTLNARSTQGGATIDVWAANGLALTGAKVWADGTATDGSAKAAMSNGGQVRLATAAGTLDFDAASVIDVRPGAKGQTGNVTFIVARDEQNNVAPVHLNGTVLGARGSNGQAAGVALEAKRVYDASNGLDITGYAADHAAFIAGTDASALLSGLKGDLTASLHGATEVRSTGDMSVDALWDLTTPEWLANNQAGTLTLRAAGNLTVSNALGMPDDKLLAGDTWNIRLVGGADLNAANPLAVQPHAVVAASQSGNVLISGDSGKVRTGTGSIEIAAAGDFRMDSLKSVVYTVGKIGATDLANVAAVPATEDTGEIAAKQYDRWAQDGGNISISAGGDAVGNSDEWITEWLRRPRSATEVPAEWWAYRPNFQQGLGTLGGGDISITAGHDVNGLSAMLPTTGRSAEQADGTRVLDVQGGGNLQVRAGNDLIGGSYLVGRGTGSLNAGGRIGGATPTQLFMMGVSSGDVPAQATMALSAGGDVTLQSVNNPTAMSQSASVGTGPSFGAGAFKFARFFSYADDSGVSLLAKSGDVAIQSTMAPGRGLAAGNRSVTLSDASSAGAFPASLSAAAFEGDVSLEAARKIVTYPSASASISLLAQGALFNPNLTVSDLSQASVIGVGNPKFDNAALSGLALLPTAGQDRIVKRSAVSGYRFDFQALSGDVTSTGEAFSDLLVPGASRVRAGRDISRLALTLQNLIATDVSEVRAEMGDVRNNTIEIRGPGALLVQAGRNIDLGQVGIPAGEGGSYIGGLVATANNGNTSLDSSDAARLVVVAGVNGQVDTNALKGAYDALTALNGHADQILAFYRALNGDTDRSAVANAATVQDLVQRDSSYAPYADLVSRYPEVLKAYQGAAQTGTSALPLGTGAEAAQAAALYAALNRETDVSKITSAAHIADLGAAYAGYAALDAKYPRIFADYRARRSHGALPVGLTPIVLSDALAQVTAAVVPADKVTATGGNILTFQSSIQTYGNGSGPSADCSGQCLGQGDIDLWTPNGYVLAGLTTPAVGTTIGVVTNGGGAIRSVTSGDFIINQGKVLTAQGGDILLFSSQGNIDAGRGAKTSLSTPPPKRTPFFAEDDQGQQVQIGVKVTIPSSAAGSGIQTLSSDPDGLGPLDAPKAGDVFLFAPAGTIDAGEAGIRSSGNLVLNAQTVLNASNISSSGSSSGVPVAVTGSLASSLAANGPTDNGAKAAQDAAKNASDAARAATASGVQKPNILTVEVLGFGDKNCKEQEKDCFAK